MFFLNTSFIFYIFLIMLAIFGLFYIWRRIYGLENYSKILEKKISNLKKENKELQELLSGNDATSIEDADTIMNKIFNLNIANNDKCCVADKTDEICNTVANTVVTTVTIDVPITDGSDNTDVPDDPDDPDMTIQNIIGLDDTTVSTKLPVVEHNDPEIESVVSDSVSGGLYNRRKLSKMNLDKLKEICANMNLPSDGTKNNLIDRILAQ